jgi:hypothetical protein
MRPKPWTPEEDAIVLKFKAIKAAKKLPWRTVAACNTRRNDLRHPPPAATNPGARWTKDECRILRAHYPSAEDTRTLWRSSRASRLHRSDQKRNVWAFAANFLAIVMCR